ncbi:hypothetical protein OHD62_35335 [Mesorhizobium sp. YC-39]|uniref:hypothetical protein n=1 Tax=unclassified Mesorhizobium TaxID=325217 RepID=UPI0021E8CF0E|nr:MULTISPECIES: hypothetical protein [unclassified Mesorhizobium]MCV3211883.1 hypothetical protein [Mesorhizobium sp. YC-2]MCV3233606.1 hypothetical protein [Mesorhizobium sp. YC-39]
MEFDVQLVQAVSVIGCSSRRLIAKVRLQGGEQAGRLPGRRFRHDVAFDGTAHKHELAYHFKHYLGHNQPRWGWTTTQLLERQSIDRPGDRELRDAELLAQCRLVDGETRPELSWHDGPPDLVLDLAGLELDILIDLHPDLLV